VHIGVIVPAYNVAHCLADCIASVIAQTRADWSLTIVDDGSNDCPDSVVARFPDPRIALIRQPNAGVSAARNTAIQASTRFGGALPDAFIFLDGDDWLAPHALAALAASLDAAPGAVAACGRYARVGPDGSVHRQRPPASGCLLERLLIRNQFANGGHLLIRRKAVEAAGRFRTDLSYGEDWEYWTRLAVLGSFAAIPLLFVRERPGSALFSRGTDPAASRPALEAIYRNPAIAERLGGPRLTELRRRADAEIAWAAGRELIRHGRRLDGWRWLGRSIKAAPSLRRMALLGLAWLRCGPFRPYRIARASLFQQYRHCD
jgi:glycosyltransferase involved in cell wall biosynthesis